MALIKNLPEECRIALKRYFSTGEGKIYAEVERKSFTEILAVNPPLMCIHNAIVNFYDARNKKVLDVGCHVGHHSFLLAEKGAEVVGVEIQSGRAKVAECLAKVRGLNVEIVNKNIEAYLNESNRTFDLTLVLNVFHHMFCHNPAIAWRVLTEISERSKVMILMVRHQVFLDSKQIKARDEVPLLILQHSLFTHYKKLFLRIHKHRDLWAFWK